MQSGLTLKVEITVLDAKEILIFNNIKINVPLNDGLFVYKGKEL